MENKIIELEDDNKMMHEDTLELQSQLEEAGIFGEN